MSRKKHEKLGRWLHELGFKLAPNVAVLYFCRIEAGSRDVKVGGDAIVFRNEFVRMSLSFDNWYPGSELERVEQAEKNA